MARSIDNMRNIGIMAHIDAGKTTTTERILYYSGKTYKMGEVDDGTAVTDWMAEEQRRGITIVAAAITTHWRDFEINIIDTPGHVDFTAEVERSLRVLDGAVAVLCGVGGVEAQTETVWRQADRYHVPRIAFINKLDRMGADFYAAVDQMESRLNANPLVLQIPIGIEKTFTGVVDLVAMRALHFPPTDYGKAVEVGAIPDDLQDEAQLRHDALIERVAEMDDEVMKAFIDEKPVDADMLKRAIRRITLSAAAVPVFCGSALHFQGVQPMMDAVCDYLPSPAEAGGVQGRKVSKKDDDELVRRKPLPEEPFAALAFKLTFDRHDNLTYVRVYSGTIKVGDRVLNPRAGKRERIRRVYRMYANKREEEVEALVPGDIVGIVGLEHTVTGDTLCDIAKPVLLEHLDFPDTVISMAVEPKSQAEKNKLVEVLDQMTKEDPTLRWQTDPDTGQVVLSGMGELHLEVVRHRMDEEFGVNANFGSLRVAYKETIKKAVEQHAEFIQTAGNRGQYAKVTLKVAPDDLQGKVAFDAVNKLQLDKTYLRAVEEAVHETCDGGIITGYPLVDIRVTLVDAEEHPVDSSDLAFYTATSNALRMAIEAAGIRLLEPIMDVEIVLPDEYFGEVLKDLRSRRSEIVEMSERSGMRVLVAKCPLAEMFGYATTLRSLTRGRGTHTMEPCDFGEAPHDVLDRIMHGGW